MRMWIYVKAVSPNIFCLYIPTQKDLFHWSEMCSTEEKYSYCAVGKKERESLFHFTFSEAGLILGKWKMDTLDWVEKWSVNDTSVRLSFMFETSV